VHRDWINIESSVANAIVGVICLLHSGSEYCSRLGDKNQQNAHIYVNDLSSL
jgi:hypothetical protein